MSALENEAIIFEGVHLLNLIAECFYYLGGSDNFDTAIKIWEITMNSYKIFEAFDLLEENKKWSNRKKDHVHEKFHFLVKYMEMAKKFARYELSMAKAQ